MDGMKPGYKTTEFWLALLAQLVPLFVLVGVLDPTEADTLQGAVAQAVAAAVALIAAVMPIYAYIKGRAEVKSSAVFAKEISE